MDLMLSEAEEPPPCVQALEVTYASEANVRATASSPKGSLRILHLPDHRPTPEAEAGGQDALSPLSQQIAELCMEMDSCLLGLDQWRKERQLQQEVLKMQLEGQHAAWEDLDSPLGFQSTEDEREIGSDCELGRSNWSGRAVVESSPLPRRDLPTLDDIDRVCLPPWSAELDAEDESRLERLRQEIEELKLQSEHGFDATCCDTALAAADASCTFSDTMGMNSTLALSSWVDEVDNILQAGELAHAQERSTLPSDSCCGDLPLEERLVQFEDVEHLLGEVRSQAGTIGGLLECTRSRLDAQVVELEDLLAECAELGSQAKASFTSPAEQEH